MSASSAPCSGVVIVAIITQALVLFHDRSRIFVQVVLGVLILLGGRPQPLREVRFQAGEGG